MNRRNLTAVVLFALLVALFTPAARPQIISATLRGTVQDAP